MDDRKGFSDMFEQNRSLVVGFGILLVIFAVLRSLVRVQYDPHEPPLIHPKIPFFGHVIGMFRYGASYFDLIQ